MSEVEFSAQCYLLSQMDAEPGDAAAASAAAARRSGSALKGFPGELRIERDESHHRELVWLQNNTGQPRRSNLSSIKGFDYKQGTPSIVLKMEPQPMRIHMDHPGKAQELAQLLEKRLKLRRTADGAEIRESPQALLNLAKFGTFVNNLLPNFSGRTKNPLAERPPVVADGDDSGNMAYTWDRVQEYSDLGEFDLLEPVDSLPPRQDGVRGPPMTLEQFRQYFPSPTAPIRNECEFRKAVFRGGLTPEVRREAWMFFLRHRCPPSMSEDEFRKTKEEEYVKMKSQWQAVLPSQRKRNRRLNEIFLSVRKDVPRTDREWEIYQDPDGAALKMMHNVLMTYAMYNFDLGYVQGMSDIASVLIYVYGNEVDAFWCFANWMDDLQDLFTIEAHGILNKLTSLGEVIRYTDPELMKQLRESESDHLLFCFQWLLVMFKREFTRTDALVIWDVLLSQYLSADFSIFICAAMIDGMRDTIVEDHLGTDEILRLSNDLDWRQSLDLVLNKAEGIFNQLRAYRGTQQPSLRPLLRTWEERHPAEAQPTASAPSHDDFDDSDDFAAALSASAITDGTDSAYHGL